ncbi:MAG TPA: DUF3347 domain-containing protein [Ferruginibacter sp.]|nr:DUF3347 domain-containing protein [Ferruginibacter sp.]
MKKLFIITLLSTIGFHGFSQDSTHQKQLSALLQSYFDIKNALVAANASTASLNAGSFIKMLNAFDTGIITSRFAPSLLKDAAEISGSSDIRHQREHFATLSTDFYSLAKAVKLTSQPLYYAYCPMKKVYWLSNEAAIKNPYYGNMMLTCGKVTETLQ